MRNCLQDPDDVPSDEDSDDSDEDSSEESSSDNNNQLWQQAMGARGR